MRRLHLSALAALLSLAGCSHVGSSLQLTIPTWVFTYGGTFLAALLSLAGCSQLSPPDAAAHEAPPAPETFRVVQTYPASHAWVMHDDVRRVTCWGFSDRRDAVNESWGYGGISCLPDAQIGGATSLPSASAHSPVTIQNGRHGPISAAEQAPLFGSDCWPDGADGGVVCDHAGRLP